MLRLGFEEGKTSEMTFSKEQAKKKAQEKIKANGGRPQGEGGRGGGLSGKKNSLCRNGTCSIDAARVGAFGAGVGGGKEG